MNPFREQFIDFQKWLIPPQKQPIPILVRNHILWVVKEFLAKAKISSGFPAYHHTLIAHKTTFLFLTKKKGKCIIVLFRFQNWYFGFGGISKLVNPSCELFINFQKMADPATETTDPNTGKKSYFMSCRKLFNLGQNFFRLSGLPMEQFLSPAISFQQHWF